MAKLHCLCFCLLALFLSETLTTNKVGAAVCPDFITIVKCKYSDCNKICFDRHKQGSTGFCVGRSACSCFYRCDR
ncbi:hypothetical protein DCAR_0418254 [Daucus carota subsp. sativus]|uniref:Knottin scorpion toxin-like domain-containing protein n=1 Tax=Daucus carota subsp. sativus TaxID=79200 RepID=A0AAF1AXA9_DAUCS|nr:hypothetical protein DCAR_0418254 [Daucus carota subsp. sativus]